MALLTTAPFWRLPSQYFPAFVPLMNCLQPSPVYDRNQEATVFLANTSVTLTTCWGLFKVVICLKPLSESESRSVLSASLRSRGV